MKIRSFIFFLASLYSFQAFAGNTSLVPTPRDVPPEIIAGVSNLIRQIQVRLPQSEILLLALFPRSEKADSIREQVKAVNAGIAKFDDGSKIKFLDLGHNFLTPDGTSPRDIFPDRLHPNTKGNQIWADAMEPVLAEMLN